jgi:hypothetical protein
MDFSLANIGFDKLFIGDFNSITFSLFGMILVFSGLIAISLFITVLPKIANRPRKSSLKGGSGGQESSMDILAEKEVLLAIAVAFHLDQDFPEENEKITWKSHGDIISPWQMSGRAHGLSVRSHIRVHR